MKQRCNASGIAKDFSFQELKEVLAKKYKSTIIRDVIEVSDNGKIGFIFRYGVIVLWGFSFDDEKRLLDQLEEYRIAPYENIISDDFTFAVSEQKVIKINEDHIALAEGDNFEKLAISHAIAQSIKLTFYEELIIKTIENTRHIPENLAKKGATQLSRKQLAKERGRLYLTKSNINLHYDLLDTPEFFWEYPELEPYYQRMASYLDIKPRIEVLNKKLEIIHELFGMLADEQAQKHSLLLEWIIIILIALELVIPFFHDIFNFLLRFL